jgi:hypothetical protein
MKNSSVPVDAAASLETEGGTRPPTPKLRKRYKLHTIEEVRREMARVYRDARTGAIDAKLGARLAYMLTQIAQLIESGELEKRVRELEARQIRSLQ